LPVVWWSNSEGKSGVLVNTSKRRTMYITSLIDTNNNLLKSLVANYSVKSSPSLTVVEHPRDAEFIILADTGYFGWSDLVASIDRCSVFDGKHVLTINNSDWPYPVFDGFYPSLTRQWPGAFSWGFYLGPAPHFIESGQVYQRKFLYSFVGRARTHRVRQKLLALDAINTPCIDIDNIPERLGNFDYYSSYQKFIYDSEFVLCPRGFGASSIRLFEVMRAGRTPVIISNKWIAPPLVNWTGFAIRVREDDIFSIPNVLEYHKDEANERGRLAKHEYDRYYRSDIYLETIINMYLERRPTLFSRDMLFKRAIVRSGIREFRSLVNLGNRIKGLRSVFDRLMTGN
jgi:hypothetical protein